MYSASVNRSRGIGLLVVAAASAVAACGIERPSAASTARPTVRVITGTRGGGILPFAESLATVYRQGLPDVTVEVKPSPGAVANADAIQNGDADVGFIFADVTYTAFVGGLSNAAPYDRLRAIAVLQIPAVHLVVRPGSGISGIADLRGRRVGIGPPGSGTALTVELLLGAFGLSRADLRADTKPFDDAAREMIQGNLDAMFDDAIYPAEAIRTVTAAGARLMPIVGPSVDRLRHTYPFFRVTTIPPHSYPSVTEPVRTIGVDTVLVCRRDLGEGLVYELTRLFLEALPTLSSSQEALRYMDLDQAPAAPIPLHEGAARYYRERELMR
jgi:TRAP transporter TAXI family solute receptor